MWIISLHVDMDHHLLAASLSIERALIKSFWPSKIKDKMTAYGFTK